MPPERQPYIIAMTANAFDDQRRIYLESGMNDYVSKPVRPAVCLWRRSIARLKPTWSHVSQRAARASAMGRLQRRCRAGPICSLPWRVRSVVNPNWSRIDGINLSFDTLFPTALAGYDDDRLVDRT